MAYAVVSDPAAVDIPDVPSYQPYVYGRLDLLALIPLQTKENRPTLDGFPMCFWPPNFFRRGAAPHLRLGTALTTKRVLSTEAGSSTQALCSAGQDTASSELIVTTTHRMTKRHRIRCYKTKASTGNPAKFHRKFGNIQCHIRSLRRKTAQCCLCRLSWKTIRRPIVLHSSLQLRRLVLHLRQNVASADLPEDHQPLPRPTLLQDGYELTKQILGQLLTFNDSECEDNTPVDVLDFVSCIKKQKVKLLCKIFIYLCKLILTCDSENGASVLDGSL